MPAVAHSPAAVVRPRTALPCLKITPAPRKLMPLTTWAAIRAGSAPRMPLYMAPAGSVRSAKPYLDTIISRAEAQHTMIWVRMPASLYRLLRSAPMQAPHTQAAAMRRKKSTFCHRENWLFIYSDKVIATPSPFRWSGWIVPIVQDDSDFVNLFQLIRGDFAE